MGWNEGYTVMEAAVIAAYDEGVLTSATLRRMLEPYVGTDIDHGGCKDLKAKDGKSADDVVLSILCPEKYERLCRMKAALEMAGIRGETIWGIGDVLKGAKVFHQYGDARVIRDRRTHGGFRVEKTREWAFGQDCLWTYQDCYYDALKEATGWC